MNGLHAGVPWQSELESVLAVKMEVVQVQCNVVIVYVSEGACSPTWQLPYS